MADSMTSVEATALIDASWRRWLAAIAAVPESRWSEASVCGDWSIKDLLGHMAVWDQMCINYLGRQARCEKGGSYDWQAINDEAAAARADRTIAEQRTEMNETHGALLETLKTPVPFDSESLGESSWLHYDEHAEQVRAWS